MSDRLPALSSPDGELVSVKINVDPRYLEDLLECLAELDFPVNPQIVHGRPTLVEFPAYEAKMASLRKTLQSAGFAASAVSSNPMVDTLFAKAS